MSGAILPELGNLVSLESVLLDGNGLSGPIPPELGNLDNLTALSFYGNRLSGQVPSELLANKANLTWLSLDGDGDRLIGCVPTALRDQLVGAGGRMLGLPFCDLVPPPRPCAAGMTLRPGDYCTFGNGPRDRAWDPEWRYRFWIRDGDGCLGYLAWFCSTDGIDSRGLSASRYSDGSWKVHSVQ